LEHLGKILVILCDSPSHIKSSIYHFYCLSTNTTTIEGWEKDKVATLVRRGKIHEVCTCSTCC